MTSRFPENEISGDQKRERSEPSPLALSGAVGGAKPARWASNSNNVNKCASFSVIINDQDFF